MDGARLPKARRQELLAILACDGGGYAAVYVEDSNPDPVITALATPDDTCELLMPRDRHAPFAVLRWSRRWEGQDAEPDLLWGRVAITEPGGRTAAVDTPSDYNLPEM